jgi:hypothetical protein
MGDEINRDEFKKVGPSKLMQKGAEKNRSYSFESKRLF